MPDTYDIINATKLDACCTAEANAIRSKTGSSAQIAYDWSNSKGFADAIAAIPTGGGGLAFADYIAGTVPTGAVSVTPTSNIPSRGISGRNGITELTIDLAGTYYFSERYAITNNNSLQRLIVKRHPVSGLYGAFIDYCVVDNNALTQVIIRDTINGIATNSFRTNSALQLIDIEKSTAVIGNNAFYNCNALNIIILRQSDSLCPITTGTFNNTPFKNGGTGGTVYIPKVLYDHLGDNSSLDYKAASNWSTYDGYGTITWAKIEGSAYESLTWYEP